MWTEAELREKLRKIEALHAGAGSEGERAAAADARARIMAKLAQAERTEQPVETKVTLGDGWHVRLFVALCRRYGLDPYRLKGQRRTTVMVKVPPTFLDGTLWPEFQDLAETLRAHLEAVTARIIDEEIGEVG